MDQFIKVTLKITAILAGVVLIVLAILGRFSWALGFLIANLWAIANLFLTIHLFKIALLERSKSKLTLMLLIKFPLLYLAGLLVLVLRIFPVSSLLAGLAPVLIAGGIVKIWPKSK